MTTGTVMATEGGTTGGIGMKIEIVMTNGAVATRGDATTRGAATTSGNGTTVSAITGVKGRGGRLGGAVIGAN
jgi:hypothetical protein